MKKTLALDSMVCYHNPCCDVDSVEAVVAAAGAGNIVERMSGS